MASFYYKEINFIVIKDLLEFGREEVDFMKGFVDKNACVGCGLCTGICPEIFEMNDEGLAVGSENEIPENLLESANDAKDQCPVSAITIE